MASPLHGPEIPSSPISIGSATPIDESFASKPYQVESRGGLLSRFASAVSQAFTSVCEWITYRIVPHAMYENLLSKECKNIDRVIQDRSSEIPTTIQGQVFSSEVTQKAGLVKDLLGQITSKIQHIPSAQIHSIATALINTDTATLQVIKELLSDKDTNEETMELFSRTSPEDMASTMHKISHGVQKLGLWEKTNKTTLSLNERKNLLICVCDSKNQIELRDKTAIFLTNQTFALLASQRAEEVPTTPPMSLDTPTEEHVATTSMSPDIPVQLAHALEHPTEEHVATTSMSPDIPVQLAHALEHPTEKPIIDSLMSIDGPINVQIQITKKATPQQFRITFTYQGETFSTDIVSKEDFPQEQDIIKARETYQEQLISSQTKQKTSLIQNITRQLAIETSKNIPILLTIIQLINNTLLNTDTNTLQVIQDLMSHNFDATEETVSKLLIDSIPEQLSETLQTITHGVKILTRWETMITCPLPPADRNSFLLYAITSQKNPPPEGEPTLESFTQFVEDFQRDTLEAISKGEIARSAGLECALKLPSPDVLLRYSATQVLLDILNPNPQWYADIMLRAVGLEQPGDSSLTIPPPDTMRDQGGYASSQVTNFPRFEEVRWHGDFTHAKEHPDEPTTLKLTQEMIMTNHRMESRRVMVPLELSGITYTQCETIFPIIQQIANAEPFDSKSPDQSETQWKTLLNEKLPGLTESNKKAVLEFLKASSNATFSLTLELQHSPSRATPPSLLRDPDYHAAVQYPSEENLDALAGKGNIFTNSDGRLCLIPPEIPCGGDEELKRYSITMGTQDLFDDIASISPPPSTQIDEYSTFVQITPMSGNKFSVTFTIAEDGKVTKRHVTYSAPPTSKQLQKDFLLTKADFRAGRTAIIENPTEEAMQRITALSPDLTHKQITSLSQKLETHREQLSSLLQETPTSFYILCERITTAPNDIDQHFQHLGQCLEHISSWETILAAPIPHEEYAHILDILLKPNLAKTLEPLGLTDMLGVAKDVKEPFLYLLQETQKQFLKRRQENVDRMIKGHPPLESYPEYFRNELLMPITLLIGQTPHAKLGQFITVNLLETAQCTNLQINADNLGAIFGLANGHKVQRTPPHLMITRFGKADDGCQASFWHNPHIPPKASDGHPETRSDFSAIRTVVFASPDMSTSQVHIPFTLKDITYSEGCEIFQFIIQYQDAAPNNRGPLVEEKKLDPVIGPHIEAIIQFTEECELEIPKALIDLKNSKEAPKRTLLRNSSEYLAMMKPPGSIQSREEFVALGNVFRLDESLSLLPLEALPDGKPYECYTVQADLVKETIQEQIEKSSESTVTIKLDESVIEGHDPAKVTITISPDKGYTPNDISINYTISLNGKETTRTIKYTPSTFNAPSKTTTPAQLLQLALENGSIERDILMAKADFIRDHRPPEIISPLIIGA